MNKLPGHSVILIPAPERCIFSWIPAWVQDEEPCRMYYKVQSIEYFIMCYHEAAHGVFNDISGNQTTEVVFNASGSMAYTVALKSRIEHPDPNALAAGAAADYLLIEDWDEALFKPMRIDVSKSIFDQDFYHRDYPHEGPFGDRVTQIRDFIKSSAGPRAGIDAKAKFLYDKLLLMPQGVKVTIPW